MRGAMSQAAWRTAWAVSLLAGASTSPVLADEPTVVPRYALAVGQELTFSSQGEFKFETGAHVNSNDWTVWVIRKNDNGSFRVVLRDSSIFRQLSNSAPAKRNANEQPDVTIGFCDIFDDGRIAAKEGLGYQLDPSVLFPKLPKDANEVKEGWERAGSYDSLVRYKQAGDGPESNTFSFEGVSESPSDKIYVSSHSYRFQFDRKRGLLGRAETQSTQGYGFNGKGTGTTELKGVETHDAAWLKPFTAAADAYFAATKVYEDLTTKAEKDKEFEALLTKAEDSLKDAQTKVEVPLFREQLDRQIKQHRSMLSYYKQSAKERAEVLGKPSADWETKDLAGKTHTLKDYHGKVVLLDFWYRGCGWCIRAMPQVKQIAAEFEGQPVAVLGMNTDRDEKDAQLVIETMGLNYPNLKAEGLPEKYHVRGFPTLVILDQEGNVADLHVGYSPKLREEVTKSVKRLLEKK